MTDEMRTIDSAWAWSPFKPDEKHPWNAALAAHLYRRGGFGATQREVAAAVEQTPAAAVKQLFAVDAAGAEFAREMDEFSASLEAGGKAENLAGGWLYRMLRTPVQLLEKLTLFWHGHFATSAAKVTDASLMLQQNALLRGGAFGPLGELVQAIARDPAMLLYLDSAYNRKAHPNENFAREVMELFCLGLDRYTERDVQELARCFTGWEVHRGKFFFNAAQHDGGPKSLLGKTGDFGGEEALQIILDQPAAPEFIACKLVRFFISDELELSAALVQPLADDLRSGGFRMAPVVERILGSELFFSPYALGRKIRSPVELAVGWLRSLEGTTNIQRLAVEVGQLGQALFYPPSVKGWDGGRTWINSSTLLGRANLVRSILDDPQTRFAGGTLTALVERENLTTPEGTVDWFAARLLAVPLPMATRERLVALAASSGDRKRVLSDVLHALATLPEFQLG